MHVCKYWVVVMSINFYRISIIALLSLFAANITSAYAKSKRGTPEEAIAMVNRVIKMAREEGLEKTFTAVSNLTHGFRDRDLYPFVMHISGYMAAHPLHSLRGLDINDMRDATGRYFFRNMISAIKKNGRGWAGYQYPNPVTKAIEEKATFVKSINKEYFVGVGIFKKTDKLDQY